MGVEDFVRVVEGRLLLRLVTPAPPIGRAEKEEERTLLLLLLLLEGVRRPSEEEPPSSSSSSSSSSEPEPEPEEEPDQESSLSLGSVILRRRRECGVGGVVIRDRSYAIGSLVVSFACFLLTLRLASEMDFSSVKTNLNSLLLFQRFVIFDDIRRLVDLLRLLSPSTPTPTGDRAQLKDK